MGKKDDSGAKVSYGGFSSPLGPVMAASAGGALTDLSIGIGEAAFLERLGRRFGPGAALARSPGAFAALFSELERYLDGASVTFSMVLDPGGTRFEKKVWRELLRIPRGRVVSYGEVARAVGLPHGARAVGRACGANPIPIIIPCHRVVRSDGSLGGYSAGEGRRGLEIKRALLEIEGLCL
ncbi:MAG: methylated-DNA--[protein]-cysteine S-methyltransferase [Thermodesulfobacteriota bacterium]